MSTTIKLPSASSITSVGWKSRLSETRKSVSRVVYVEPLGTSTWRVTFAVLNWAQNRLSTYSAPNAVDS